MTILRMFGGIAARCGRRAERTPTYSDRTDRLKPNIVFSKRDSNQRRGHLTVCKVASNRLTLPRTRLTKPRTSTKFETTCRARSDRSLLSRRAQPPLGTGKGTRTRVVALHRCATRPATAAIGSVGPVPPTKIAGRIVIPRRADSFPGHSRNNSSRHGTVRPKPEKSFTSFCASQNLCRMGTRTGRTTGARRRHYTALRFDKSYPCNMTSPFIAQAYWQTRRRRALWRVRARNRFLLFHGAAKKSRFPAKKNRQPDCARHSARRRQCAASARLTTRLREKYLRMVDGFEILAV